MSGIGQMLQDTNGETVIQHPPLPNWDSDQILRIAVSCSARQVFVSAFNSNTFIVNSLTTDENWTFYWMIVSVGVSDNLEA